MTSRKKVPARVSSAPPAVIPGYEGILAEIAELLESSRRSAARAVNSIITATYWDIGRRIVEFEQGGAERSEYGTRLIERLAADLSARFGRGFGYVNLTQMRRFYLSWPPGRILQAASEESVGVGKLQTVSERSSLAVTSSRLFPLPWSHYVRLLASRKKSAMLKKGQMPRPEDVLTPEDEIKDPFILEFLGLKDEYSEHDFEEALLRQLETFLLELGGDFAFVGRQRRLRIGDEWFRADLVFFHRKLRCLVIIDLKLGKFTHADAGQMHIYLNYASEHWMNDGENPPVGIILCTEKDHAVVRYALEGLPNKVLAAEYRTKLPDEAILAAELDRRRKVLESRPERNPKSGK